MSNYIRAISCKHIFVSPHNMPGTARFPLCQRTLVSFGSIQALSLQLGCLKVLLFCHIHYSSCSSNAIISDQVFQRFNGCAKNSLVYPFQSSSELEFSDKLLNKSVLADSVPIFLSLLNKFCRTNDFGFILQINSHIFSAIF